MGGGQVVSPSISSVISERGGSDRYVAQHNPFLLQLLRVQTRSLSCVYISDLQNLSNEQSVRVRECNKRSHKDGYVSQ